jgi:hypothetical protein
MDFRDITRPQLEDYGMQLEKALEGVTDDEAKW